jgi:hypothetical protein
MRLGLVLGLIVVSTKIFAQAPDTLWTRTFGIGGTGFTDWHFVVEQTQEGGYVATGRHQQNNFDIPLLKLDANGDTTWIRYYGTPTIFEGAYAIDQTADGGYILAGGTDLGHVQPLLVKTTGDGTQEWMRVYLPAEDPHQVGTSLFAVHELPNGDFFATGQALAGGGNAPIRQFFAMRVNSATGDTIWTRQYGGPEYEWCHDAILTSDGNALLVGSTSSFGAIGDDIWVLKISLSGDSLWSRRYGTTDNEECNAVVQTADGGFALTGYKGENLFLLKISAVGDSVTSVEIPTGVGTSIQELAGGDLSIAGVENNVGDHNLWLLRTSPTFNMLWSTVFGGVEENACQGHAVTSDGGYVLGGFTNLGGNRQLTVVRYEEDRGVSLFSPNGGEAWTLYDSATVQWSGIRFNGNISIELNRSYPGGEWELLAPNEANDGEHTMFVDAPLSGLCRVRVSALEDTFSDISDADFAIVSSQGYLGLYSANQPNNPVLLWNGGILECPSITEVTYALKNFGNQAIQVFRPIEPPTSPFSRVISGCPLQFVLQPGEVSGCQVTLHFVPESDGVVMDTLRIQTNASNAIGAFLKVPLSGEQISTPAAPEVVITSQGEDAILYWSAVDTSVGGCAVSGLRYLVFYSPTSGGPFYYHGGTTDTTYTHVWAVTYAPAMFYQVVAVKAPALLLNELEVGMEMGEVMAKIEAERVEGLNLE